MVLNVPAQKPLGLSVGDGENGGEAVYGGRGRASEREIIYLSLHCHHQNDSCIKMGSDESHLNVSLIVRDNESLQDGRQCPQTTTFEEKGEPKRYRTEVLTAYQPTALPLGQSGSQNKL